MVRLTNHGVEYFYVAQNEINGEVPSSTSAVVIFTVRTAGESLAHSYTFTKGAEDFVGGPDGEMMESSSVVNGAVALNGTAGTHVNWPGDLMSNYAAVTFEFWASFVPRGNWARGFDFGDQNSGSLGWYHVRFTRSSGFIDCADRVPPPVTGFYGVVRWPRRGWRWLAVDEKTTESGEWLARVCRPSHFCD